MKPKEPSDAPLEEGPNPPRINLLAMISLFIGIGAPIGFCYIVFEHGEVEPMMLHLLLIAILATAVVGAFCGHCAREQIRTRRPHQNCEVMGEVMAGFGLLGCYVCIGLALCLCFLWLVSFGFLVGGHTTRVPDPCYMTRL